MLIKQNLLHLVSHLNSMRRLFTPHKKGFRVLAYHAVGSEVADDIYGLFSIEFELFKNHIEILKNYGVDLISIEEKNRNPSNLSISLTFDDGYKDNLLVVAPFLATCSIPFSVFVSTSFTLEKNDGRYLTPVELKKLSKFPGVTIASHSHNHIPLAKCSDTTLKEELKSSKQILEDIIGKEVTSISYPFGSVNKRVSETAKEMGYRKGFCSRFDINDIERDPMLLCRTEISARDTERIFLQKLKGDWDWYKYRHQDPTNT